MTPTEHYTFAESWLEEAERNYADDGEIAALQIAIAQVHATLATAHPEATE